MKKLTTILLITFSISLQAQTYFNNRYSYDGSSSLDFCHDVLMIEDGYLIPGGYTTEENYPVNSFGIIKIDTFGVIQQVKVYGDNIYGYNFAYTQGGFRQVDSDFFSVGLIREYTGNWVHDQGAIYKFNRNLDTLWTKKIGDKQYPYDTNYLFRYFDVLQNNELIIAGSIVVDGSVAKALLIKTDSLGNELWRKYFANGDKNVGINVIQTPDNGFAISCYLWTFGLYGISAPYLVKTDSLGNEQWRHYIQCIDQKHGPMYLQVSNDNTIVGAYEHSDIVAYPATDSYNRDALLKIDLEGNLIWQNTYGMSHHSKHLNSLNINNEGKLIVTGNKYNEEYSQRISYMLNCNNNGDSLWYREYELLHEPNSNNNLYGVSPTSDGGYIAVGHVNPLPPDTGNQDVWVVKVDSMGCVSMDECWTGVEEHIAMRESEKLKIYPNPAINEVNIFIPKESESETHELVIYDMYGHKVEETSIPQYQTTKTINVAQRKSGLYTVISYYNGVISGRGKFIIR